MAAGRDGRAEQRLLVLEVPIDAELGYLRPLGDLVQCRRLKTQLHKEFARDVDYAFSAITAVGGLADAVRMCAYAGTATLVGVPPPGRTLDLDVERDLFGPKVSIAVTHGGDT